MIRRTIWLTAGAVIGIAGYRRLDRAAKALTGRLVTTGPGPAATLPAVRQSAGMPAVPVQLPARSASSPAAAVFRAAAWLVRQLRASAGFAAEVRAGMDEYLDARQPNIDRQHARSRNTLGGRRAAIGAGDHDATKDGR